MVKITKAVIPAAGLGSRMYPFTKVESKLMIPIINKPMVEYLVEELAASGIKEVIIVSNHIEKIKEFFKENKSLNALLKRMKKENLIEKLHHVEYLCKIDLIRQYLPMGWMHEVLHAKDYVKNEPFVVCFSDVLYDSKIPAAKQAINVFSRTHMNVKARARFVLKPSVFELMKKEKYQFGQDVADIDIFNHLEKKKDLAQCHIKGTFMDIGEPLPYLKTVTLLGLKDQEFGDDYRAFLKELMLR
jgi:UTP--glucose-1-phosphate uridylyltransferase